VAVPARLGSFRESQKEKVLKNLALLFTKPDFVYIQFVIFFGPCHSNSPKKEKSPTASFTP
jgi:hypothetical protein